MNGNGNKFYSGVFTVIWLWNEAYIPYKNKTFKTIFLACGGNAQRITGRLSKFYNYLHMSWYLITIETHFIERTTLWKPRVIFFQTSFTKSMPNTVGLISQNWHDNSYLITKGWSPKTDSYCPQNTALTHCSHAIWWSMGIYWGFTRLVGFSIWCWNQ